MELRQIVVLVLIACCTNANSVRAKRQLSPAVQLESELHPLMMGMYGFDSENPAYKRSPLGLKRHISPSFDVEENVGNLRTLMNVGKRQVSIANDVGRQMQMYNRLIDAGKKRAALSPSQDLLNELELSSYLERAGRK
ncbi:Neuropeptide-like peptide 11 family protein [Dictyocaulus viviparus]|uniref:Neuropeptide-like peptide 11 family protein n=1 Tax=Dictyocaulus viviparus TaxID=29172 RepID=A0A0D8Y7M7_DICVI|nr:Neuropeptide-like peptide 11 family protein [Dictyocaulus viviparus]